MASRIVFSEREERLWNAVRTREKVPIEELYRLVRGKDSLDPRSQHMHLGAYISRVNRKLALMGEPYKISPSDIYKRSYHLEPVEKRITSKK